MSILKNLAFVAFICGSIYVLYLNRDSIIQTLRNKHTNMTKKRSKPLSNAMMEVCQAFIAYADYFEGLYEPLFLASQGIISRERKYNLLAEWNIRMNNISQIPIVLKSWWNTIIANLDKLSDEDLQDRAILIVKMLIACEIKRDSQKELIARNDTTMFYQNTEGKTWNVGQKLLVESPCWYIRTNPARVIEKGYCTIK